MTLLSRHEHKKKERKIPLLLFAASVSSPLPRSNKITHNASLEHLAPDRHVPPLHTNIAGGREKNIHRRPVRPPHSCARRRVLRLNPGLCALRHTWSVECRDPVEILNLTHCSHKFLCGLLCSESEGCDSVLVVRTPQQFWDDRVLTVCLLVQIWELCGV